MRRSPNTHLIGTPDSRARLATPALLLDLDACEYNIALMSNYCREAGIGLRPHAKSHKCTRIAALQRKTGAMGVATATVREAEAMIAAGMTEVLITSPVVGETKIDWLCSLIHENVGLTIVVDSSENVRALDMALIRHRKSLSVLIDIDVGMKRTGVATIVDAVALARIVRGSQAMKFAGLQCYSGLVQHIPDAAERAATYGAELRHLERLIHELKSIGLAPRIVSGGGTGTFDFDRHARLFTEVQPGSYLLMDSQYDCIELFAGNARPFKIALYVQSTVISNQHAGHVTLDAGVKSFATDGPTPSPAAGAPSGAKFDFDGDEFGTLRFAQPHHALELGSKVELVAPHCDPTVNLHDYYHCVRADMLLDIWPIDARGSL
jgi:D-serine deaminase-like pyridoxal phosphate-dependent protein